MIIYGGTREQIEQQLECDHDWHGPCMDDKYRYMKCGKCFCVDRDIMVNDEKGALEHIPATAREVEETHDLIHEVEQLRARRKETLVLNEKLREERYELLAEIDRQLGTFNAEKMTKQLKAPAENALYDLIDENLRKDAVIEELNKHAVNASIRSWVDENWQPCPKCNMRGFTFGIRCQECSGIGRVKGEPVPVD